MASETHIKLANLIKTVHSDLRKKAKNKGFLEVWNEHCRNDDLLQEYSVAMKLLATNHWQSNFNNESKAVCRVEWIKKYCCQYFFSNEEHNEKIRQRQRELEISKKISLSLDSPFCTHEAPLKLLDVGSCYNPFSAYDVFDVLAIDIAPACVSVKKIDFLKSTVGNELNGELNILPFNYFDIVVFSLFLEYIPCPESRLKCCKKALEILKPEGLLMIITPDSKHVGANAKLMKSWRFLLAEIGFSRIKYEKFPHIHCMVFRKSIHPSIAQRWSVLHESSKIFEEMFIPQDFTNEEEKKEDCES